jgi:hypothetical protein
LQKEKQRKTTRESAQRSKEKRAQSSEWLQSGRKAMGGDMEKPLFFRRRLLLSRHLFEQGFRPSVPGSRLLSALRFHRL